MFYLAEFDDKKNSVSVTFKIGISGRTSNPNDNFGNLSRFLTKYPKSADKKWAQF